MKFTKVLVALAIAGLMVGGSVYAQTFTASNELSSDIVNYTKGDAWASKNDIGETEFAGITEKVTAEYKAVKIDYKLVLPVKFSIDDYKDANGEISKDKGHFYFTDDVSGYFDFRPWGGTGYDYLTLVMNYNDSVNTPGSYLPVKDGNLDSGDIGPDFGLVLRPIAGLRIAGGVDIFPDGGRIGTWFGVSDEKPRLHFGADYSYGSIFTMGLALKDIADSDLMLVGAHLRVGAIKNLILTAGFTYDGSKSHGVWAPAMYGNDVPYASGEIGFDAGLEYSFGKNLPLVLAADFAMGMNGFKTLPDKDGKTDNRTSLYTGAKVSYGITQQANVYLPVRFGTILGLDAPDNFATWCLEIAPSFDYTVKRHTFSVGATVDLGKEWVGLKFPVSWKYSF